MSSKVEKIEDNVAKLEIHVPPEDFAKAMEKAYRKNVKRFNIPGFRKGKAPMKIIEMQYGEGVFYEDAFDFVFPEAYRLSLIHISFSWEANPWTVLTRLGIRSALLFSWFSTCAHWAFASSSNCTKEL